MQQKVLIIGKNKTICLIYQACLEDEGFDIDMIGCIEEAREKIHLSTPDLIILDGAMHQQKHYDTLHNLRSELFWFKPDKYIPIIVSSNFKEEKYIQNAYKNGADKHIVRSNMEQIARIGQELQEYMSTTSQTLQ